MTVFKHNPKNGVKNRWIKDLNREKENRFSWLSYKELNDQILGIKLFNIYLLGFQHIYTVKHITTPSFKSTQLYNDIGSWKPTKSGSATATNNKLSYHLPLFSPPQLNSLVHHHETWTPTLEIRILCTYPDHELLLKRSFHHW